MAILRSEHEADAAQEDRVLVLAPYGRDGPVIVQALAQAGLRAEVAGSISQLCSELAAGAGAVILTVETFRPGDLRSLASVLAAQPPWSDLPLIVLFQGRDTEAAQRLFVDMLGRVGNLNMLERPMRTEALVNAVRLALRARRRQYQARARIRQLDQARQELAEMSQEAVRANEAKSRFLAAASHDLRQPFQAMRLFHHVVTIALRETPTAEAAARLGEAIQSGEELLNALLDLSTLESGVTKVAITDLSVADVLRAVANDLGAVAAAKRLSLRVRARDLMVRSDPVLLKRIVRNLAINAIRYTNSGAVLVCCRARQDRVLIQVWDTGIGIAAENLGHIFEDFYQVGNAERDRAKGIGLGLSIVERTARLLGHSISVRSQPGRGSVFTLAVPRSG